MTNDENQDSTAAELVQLDDVGQGKEHGGYSHPPEKRREIAKAAREANLHRDERGMKIWSSEKYGISYKTVRRYMEAFPEE